MPRTSTGGGYLAGNAAVRFLNFADEGIDGLLVILVNAIAASALQIALDVLQV